ncbi:hypothetical protein [Flavobacterium sp. FlaQc-48]
MPISRKLIACFLIGFILVVIGVFSLQERRKRKKMK